MRRRIAGLYGLLLVFNIAVWAWAFAVFGRVPSLMGMAMLAYSFGVRHALDADHIAAIDNVTRKMMHAGKRPLTIGLMFSLGHSTVVVLATIFVATAAVELGPRLALFKAVGGVVGGIVSTLFLFAVALTNLSILLTLVRTYSRVRRGQGSAAETLHAPAGLTGRCCRLARPALALTSKSWHMYVLGFLFGLGFDTATEVSLLGLSASQAAHGLGIGATLVFPALFTAAMTWVDMTDGLLMVGAYGWALIDPMRKLHYNMAITGVSVAVAVVIGAIEGTQWLASLLQLHGGAVRVVERLCGEFSSTGAAVVAAFAAAWIWAMIAQRRRAPALPAPRAERTN